MTAALSTTKTLLAVATGSNQMETTRIDALAESMQCSAEKGVENIQTVCPIQTPLVGDTVTTTATSTTTGKLVKNTASETPPLPRNQRQQQQQGQHQESLHRRRVPGSLHPNDLPGPEIFTAFDDVSQHTDTTIDASNAVEHNSNPHSSNHSSAASTSKLVTVDLPGKTGQVVRTGTIHQINPVVVVTNASVTAGAAIAVLPSLVDWSSVQALVKLLRAYPTYDQDPDTVDGMATYEIFVDSPDLNKTSSSTPSIKRLDSDPTALPERNRLRQKLRAILHPILNERITPFVRLQYPHVCKNPKNSTENGRVHPRSCTPCYSLIRRYRHGERQSHGTHHDGHALITVVVSFSDYDTDYRGGLYVSTGYGQRQFLKLNAGDAVAHQSTLLHGVQVWNSLHKLPEQTERFSWILWYRDSVDCTDHSYEWFQECSDAGDAICQELHASKVGNMPDNNICDRDRSTLILNLNRAAAEQGNGNAAVKMARASLKLLPSELTYNATEAARYFRLAMASHHPDGHYGMAFLHLVALSNSQDISPTDHHNAKQQPRRKHQHKQRLTKVLRHLEEAALLGHVFAMFNLGVAHTYGYGTKDHGIDSDLAASWFVQSGLPEGYYVASHQAASKGDTTRQQIYETRAKVLGYYQPWRKYARLHTGSGGAGGVDLNMPWPIAHDGRRPPEF